VIEALPIRALRTARRATSTSIPPQPGSNPPARCSPRTADEHGVATLVWRHHRPFHAQRLYAALEDLACAAARSRGRFWLADRPDTLLSWGAAGGSLCVESVGPWLAALPDAA
jgi:G3E family GTPase